LVVVACGTVVVGASVVLVVDTRTATVLVDVEVEVEVDVEVVPGALAFEWAPTA
jgi:hypothetical protein